MMRRRRPTREIPFSFDSFLDIVANVVGIIIRLILVVWVGARSYSSIQNVTRLKPAAPEVHAEIPLLRDPLEDEIAQHRQALAQAEARLLEQLRSLQEAEEYQVHGEEEMSLLLARGHKLKQERTHLDQLAGLQERQVRSAALSLAEMQARSRRLTEQIQALEKLPPAQRTLHYRTPVSRPVHSEELHFECHQGRVTFVDIAAMLAEVRRGLEDKAKLLQARWLVSDVTPAVGAFRLRYALERERTMFDAALSGVAPEQNANFRYGLSEWQVEPIALTRGESVQAALAVGSEFRQIVDVVDPQQAVVTFWVYPDSFAVYRQLRDYLYDRDVVVAGRPLPEGILMASSRQGTVSRGQ